MAARPTCAPSRLFQALNLAAKAQLASGLERSDKNEW